MIQYVKLIKIIGRKTYNKLSEEQKKLIYNTAGKINLGKNVDINRMYKSIDEYDKD